MLPLLRHRPVLALNLEAGHGTNREVEAALRMPPEILAQLDNLVRLTSSAAVPQVVGPCIRQLRKTASTVGPLSVRAQRGREDIAGERFGRCLAGKQKLGLQEYTAAISACARVKKWRLGLHLFAGISEARREFQKLRGLV